MAKIVCITDCDLKGSGYLNIMMPLLSELTEKGHEIKVAGLGYQGQEHPYPFSIIPTANIQDAVAVANNLVFLWGAEIFLVAFDIPLQMSIFNQLRGLKKKYIAITPLENGPLTMTWAASLVNMDYVFFISELGKQEAIKAGLSNVDHLVVGIDSEMWRPSTDAEKKQLRNGLGIPENAYVVLTVADNQERKNLWAGMSAVASLKKQVDVPIRYILVTRKDNFAGYRLDDLTLSLGLSQEMMIFERGMPQADLWGLYAASDVFLLPSKAEGLGMPILEAMGCGIPCVGTDTGAIHELLENDRGFPVPSAFTFIDVWGNSKRDMMNVDMCMYQLKILSGKFGPSDIKTDKIHNALEYVRSRTFDVSVKQLNDKIKEMQNEPKQA